MAVQNKCVPVVCSTRSWVSWPHMRQLEAPPVRGTITVSAGGEDGSSVAMCPNCVHNTLLGQLASHDAA